MNNKRYQNIDHYYLDTMTVEKREVSRSSPMHFHHYMEIEYIVSGKGKHVFNEYSFPLVPGSAYILINSDFHQVLVEEDLTLYNLSLSEDELPKDLVEHLYHLESRKRTSVVRDEGSDHLKKLFELLAGSLSEKEHPYAKKYTVSLIESLIYCILGNSDCGISPEGDLFAMTEALIYAHKHFAENPRLSEVAQSVNLSTSYTSRLFKKQYGISYVEYLTRLKLERARYLLRYDTMSVTDVCFSCGFNSVSNFNKYFKQYEGLAPIRFREQFRRKEP